MRKVLIFIGIIFGMLLLLLLFMINIYVIFSTKGRIVGIDELNDIDADCILILGASIVKDRPSRMLEDRLLVGFNLYNAKVADKILVSGDHINDDYDEVSVMKNYLIEKGVDSENIFMDHLGLSSYDSIYRAKEIYKANRIVIVTQEYHLYRALYIAKQLGVESYGVSATIDDYHNQFKREIREILARIKDFFKCINKPTSTYLGEIFPIKGDGNRTNEGSNMN